MSKIKFCRIRIVEQELVLSTEFEFRQLLVRGHSSIEVQYCPDQLELKNFLNLCAVFSFARVDDVEGLVHALRPNDFDWTESSFPNIL